MIKTCGAHASRSRGCATCTGTGQSRTGQGSEPVRVHDCTVLDRMDFSRVAGRGFPRLAKARDMGHPAFARAPNQLQRVASADHAPPPQALSVDKRSAAGIDLELE